MFAQLEENASQLDLTTFSQAIVALAGPPIDRDRVLRLLDRARGERNLNDAQYEQLRKMILEQYPDDGSNPP